MTAWSLSLALVITAQIFAVVLLHEGGHAAMARKLGYPVRFNWRWLGPVTVWGSDDVLAPLRHRYLVPAAGPAASLAGLFVGKALRLDALTLGFTTFASLDMLVIGSLLDLRNVLRAHKRVHAEVVHAD